MTNEEILQVALRQHAIDCNCSAEDFRAAENRYVESAVSAGGRKYLKLPFALNFVYYGQNVLVTGNKKYLKSVQECLKNIDGYRIFLEKNNQQLVAKLKRRGLYLPCYAEYFLPDMNLLKELPCHYPMKVLERSEFSDLYGGAWHNALCNDRKEDDVLAVGAYDGDKLVGLAGCSADCETMWQIGIDVLPEYRNCGIAAALTSYIALETFSRGKVPFYCAAWSNLASVRNAIACGFRPAWIEMTAKPRMEMKRKK